jgi:hypothetical protein
MAAINMSNEGNDTISPLERVVTGWLLNLNMYINIRLISLTNTKGFRSFII